MKYLKFTYVDSVTGVPITEAPAANGPKFPDLEGLEFVWARESHYPASVPEFFGTCPDDVFAAVPGVIDVLTQVDWENMQADEMRARIPRTVSMRQARLALHAAGLLVTVDAAIAQAGGEAQIEWEYATEVRRDASLVEQMGQMLTLDDAALDQLFVTAATL